MAPLAALESLADGMSFTPTNSSESSAGLELVDRVGGESEHPEKQSAIMVTASTSILRANKQGITT